MGLKTVFAAYFFSRRRQKCTILHIVIAEIHYFCNRIEEISPKT